MSKVNYLNVGCGYKYHKDWVNIDMVSDSSYVQAVNLIKGIPFPENIFEVVYHSQVLEHIPKQDASGFIRECFRVLKPNGIIRVVLPDLENIVNEYLKYLHDNLNAPSESSEANYDWMMLEMFDQTVRNSKGGLMAEYLQREKLVNEKFVLDRIGFIGRNIRQDYLQGSTTGDNIRKALSSFPMFKKAARHIMGLVKSKVFSRNHTIGAFRTGGEVHMWMYDRYSLARLLRACGFTDVKLKSPNDSDIPNWSVYELDIKNGDVYDPTSLFMEARKA